MIKNLPAAVLCLSFLMPIMGRADDASSASSDWPMWRCDARRTAATAHALPDKLHVHWVRRLPPLKPAWEDPTNQERMPFGGCYEPVAAGPRLFLGASRDDRIRALDIQTGRALWEVHMDGPIRFPPVVWEDGVYVTSDAGDLACLNARTGGLIWRFQSSPSPRKVLGNGRLISAWPARGGPVIADGIVYFAAGIWPFMGTFIHALDARSGRVIWTSDGLGPQFMDQPHSNAKGFGGVAPQGALAIHGGKLLVPCGRSVPACLDAKTGRLHHFHLSETPMYEMKGAMDRHREGGSQVAATGRFFINFRGISTNLYHLETGHGITQLQGPAQPVMADPVLYLSGRTIQAFELANASMVKGKRTSTHQSSDIEEDDLDEKSADQWALRRLSAYSTDATGALIKAGNRLYAGGDGVVSAFDIAPGHRLRPAWHESVQGNVIQLIAASHHLFAVTQEGRLYAFGQGEQTVQSYDDHPQRSAPQATGENPWLTAAGIREGYCMVWGKASTALLETLLSQSNLTVIAVTADRSDTNALRKHFTAAGLYGTRISAHTGDPVTFSAPPYMASLSIAADARIFTDRQYLKSAFQSMRPYGGAMILPTASTDDMAALKNNIARAGLANAALSQQDAQWILRREGPLPGSDDWTHQYGNIANTCRSNDSLVKLPLGVLWFGGNTHMDVLPRHGHGPPEQVMAGRLIIEGINCLSARDVYTGRVLWKRIFPDLGTDNIYFDKSYRPDPHDTSYNQVHIPGANARGANYVAAHDRIYLAARKACHVLDAETGRTLTTFRLPDPKATWGYLGICRDFLVAGFNTGGYAKRYGMKMTARANYDAAVSQGIAVMDRHTGKVRWSRKAQYGFRHNAITAGDGLLFCIDAMPAPVLAHLKRRGKKPSVKPRISAFSLKTGKPRWTHSDAAFGTWLSYDETRRLLLQCGRDSRDMLGDEVNDRMAVLNGQNGRVVWDKKISHAGPCILHGSMIITNAKSTSGKAIDLLTGEPVMRSHPVTGRSMPWQYHRTYGCNYAIGGPHLLTFRSSAAGFYDLASGGGTGNFGGFKSGCTSNLIPANGVLNAPDYTRTCTCSYQNQTSLALVHMPELAYWTFSKMPLNSKRSQDRIRRLGINIGAPGDRMSAGGTLWLEYPATSGAAGESRLRIQGDPLKYFRHHSARFGGDGPAWVAASGVENLSGLRIDMGKDRTQTRQTVLIEKNANWRYLAGRHAKSGWPQPDFEDRSWKNGRAGFGYGDDDDRTRLTDMKNRYTVVYIRKTFSIKDKPAIQGMTLKIRYDDGFIAYLNGSEILRRKIGKGRGAKASGIETHEAQKTSTYALSAFMDKLRTGDNVLAIEGHNASKDSSDFTLDPHLLAEEVLKNRENFYTVRLLFAEPDGNVSPGQRIFDVFLQDRQVLKDVDILKEAGAPHHLLVKTFKDVFIADELNIRFKKKSGGPAGPVLSGVEILQASIKP